MNKWENRKNEDSLRDPGENINFTINSSVIAVPQKRERSGRDIYEDERAKKFPDLWKDTDVQVQTAQSPE